MTWIGEMVNIAITGRMCSGKTTLANALAAYGYQRVSFATRLKQTVYEAYGITDKTKDYEVTDAQGQPVTMTGRRVMQDFGQAVKQFDQNYWTRFLLRDIQTDKYGMRGPYVIDDLRFPFEADYLRTHPEVCGPWVIVRLDIPQWLREERHLMLYGRYPSPGEEYDVSETSVDHVAADVELLGWGVQPEEMAERLVASLEGIDSLFISPVKQAVVVR